MTKSNTVTLNKVVLENVVVETVNKVDGRHNNTGRPVNKKSARYKRLTKQAKYARLLSKFTQGYSFKLNKEKSETYKFSASKGKYITGVGGCIVSGIGSHVCNIAYVGRTKATGYTFVLGRKINVELNLKTLVFVSK